MIDESMYDMVDLFIKGELPPDHPFSLRVKADPEAAAAVEAQRLLKDAVIDYRVLKFQAVLQQHHEKQKLSFFNKNFKKYVPWLAGIILLAGSVYLFQHFLPKQGKDSKTGAKSQTQQQQQQQQPTKYIEVSPLASGDEPLEKNKKQLKINNSLPRLSDKTEAIKASEPTPVAAQDAIIGTAHIPLRSITPEHVEAHDPCVKLALTAKISSSLPCRGKADGTIILEDPEGGTGPYVYSLNKGKGFQETGDFINLSHGNYQIWIKDKNNCHSILDSNYYLGEKNCHVNKNFTFNPNFSATLEISKEFNENATFSIYDKSGQVLLTKSINSTDKILWDGTTDGQTLVPGLYVYIIQYISQKEEHGTITIMY